MSQSADGEPVVRTYGGWRVTRTGGLGKLTLGQSIALLAVAFVIVLVNWLAGLLWAGSLGGVAGLAAFVATIRDKHGMSAFDRRRETVGFRRSRRRGTNVFRSGILAVFKGGGGRCRLPGVLGTTRVSEHVDAYRRPFAVVHHGDGRLSVVVGLAPAGQALVDREMVDKRVALFGVWLAGLSDEVGVVDASVTVETSPDTGQRLRCGVGSRESADAPEIAREVIDSVVAGAGSSGARVRTWATISFDPAAMSSSRAGREKHALREIAARLPGLTQTLIEAGGGAVHLLPAGELARVVRIAFDPKSEEVLDDAATEGKVVDLDWSEVGPVSAVGAWDHYRHDSGLSCSWVMSRPPRGTVQSGVLQRLLEVSRDVERKRVTILYRPMDSAKAPDVVERDVDKARNRRKIASRPTARMDRDVAQAEQTSTEEAGGASIADFGMVVTATVCGPEAGASVIDASSAVESLAASSRLLVRPAYGAQDSAFALGLPLGLTPAQQRLSDRG